MRLKIDKYAQLLILSSFLWGTSFVAAKIGVTNADPYYFGMVRWIIGAEVLLIIAFAMKTFETRIFRDPMVWGIGILNMIGLTLQNVGMTQTTATNTVLLVDINVVFVAVISYFVLSERCNRYTILGLIIGVLGVAYVTTGGDMSTLSEGTLVGNILVFMAGIVWAFYIVYQKKFVDRRVEPYMTSAAVVTTAAITSIPIALIFGTIGPLDTAGGLSLIYLAVFCTGAAWLLYIMGLKGRGATDSSVILLLEIVFAMIFAIIILGEMPGWPTAIGAVLIIVSIILVNIRPNGGKDTCEGPKIT
ncbi:MAG: DMT family transporter [Methanomassiliicoccales archaeon]|nr:DMT family transporter [Methanomassiliicoccales archaeon]